MRNKGGRAGFDQDYYFFGDGDGDDEAFDEAPSSRRAKGKAKRASQLLAGVSTGVASSSKQPLRTRPTNNQLL